ncbi:hypothetical protein MRB53_004926 [Persea americana]|uniref:Uncharacterized protein n=1 Tax=Persea americana TaxID=3435 RepID=A0ACC2MC54_PERAE|nr:hypothetical protein MRB53_004926 [Persea americana]
MGSLMGLIGSVIVVIAALAQCIAAETTHNVGDSAGWTIPFNTSWASGKTFAVGDKLSFTFNAQAHDVALVTKTEYEGCTNTSNSSVSTTSPTIIILNATEVVRQRCLLNNRTIQPISPTDGGFGIFSSASCNFFDAVTAAAKDSIIDAFAAPAPASVVVESIDELRGLDGRRREEGNTILQTTTDMRPQCLLPKMILMVASLRIGHTMCLHLLIILSRCGHQILQRTAPHCHHQSSAVVVSGSNYSGSAHPLPPPSPGIALGFSKSTFTLEELTMATYGFSDANLLGEGGFGYVHRGVLANGKEVAIKSLKSGSEQGEREFQAEVEIISRVHHKHLVSLVGYCMAGGQRMLVYEFVPNNTLEFYLHGKGRPTMEWPLRLKIALGSAKGLAYLHEDCHPKIIHRDIKASNILLDFKFEAQVADFGLAKFTSDTNTHVSTRVMGTFGYLAPGYASSGKLTDKSDVFSFGVMLLELITGRRPVDSLVDWARPLLTRSLEDGSFDSLVDQRLQKNYNPIEMTRITTLSFRCFYRFDLNRLASAFHLYMV